jgi:hypothetical protein
MKKIEKLAGLVGLLLLVAFFAPFVLKLTQIDITLILLGGLALAGYDFFTSH